MRVTLRGFSWVEVTVGVLVLAVGIVWYSASRRLEDAHEQLLRDNESRLEEVRLAATKALHGVVEGLREKLGGAWRQLEHSALAREDEIKRRLQAILARAQTQELTWSYYNALRLRGEYLKLSDYVQTNVVALQNALDELADPSKWPDDVTAQEGRKASVSNLLVTLTDWLHYQGIRVRLEGFDGLVDELWSPEGSGGKQGGGVTNRPPETAGPLPAPSAAPPNSSTNALPPRPQELTKLIGLMEGVSSNLAVTANEVIARAPIRKSRDPAARHLGDAKASCRRLLHLAASAGTNGVNIRRVLDDLRPFEAGEIQVKTTLLTNLPALGPDLGTAVAMAGAVTNLPALSQTPGWEPSIRLAQTAMRLALLGLALLVVAALYWRAAVAPLRLELARTNAALDQQNRMEHFGLLAGELAHEIGNALAAVAARLFKLRKSLPEGTPERESLARIEQEVDRLDRLAKDARKLARRAEPRLAPLEADGLLREIRDFLAPQLEPRQIQLRLGDLAGLRVRADANQMKQVLVNLVQNAAEALGERGNITLRSRRGQVNIDGQDTDCVIFEVQDDGPGIPLDVQERLFEPFFSTKEQGTGLGLPIAKRIVKGHGGTLTFETQPTKGTTFLVSLPLLQETQHHA